MNAACLLWVTARVLRVLPTAVGASISSFKNMGISPSLNSLSPETVNRSNLSLEGKERNSDRFPDDFMFQLTTEEFGLLKFQIGMSNQGRGGRRYLPYVFTVHGVAMLSSVLRSERAIQVNIAIMRAFIRPRSILAAHKELAKKIESLEKETKATFKVVFELINKHLKPAAKLQPKIGYRTQDRK